MTSTNQTPLPDDPYMAKFDSLCRDWNIFGTEQKTARLFWLEARAILSRRPAASDAGAVPVLTPSPGLRRAYQEVFNGAAPPTQPEKQAALAVGRVRHFQYSGIARNGFSQEPELFDGAPILPDGALLYAYPPAPIQQPTGHSFDAGRAVWVSRDEAERMFPAPSQQAGADAPTRLMHWHDGAGLLWDVYAFGKWLHRVVSPLNWDAHAVYLDLQRAGYASHIDVQLVSPSNTAAPAAQGDELSGISGELTAQPSGNPGELAQSDERAAFNARYDEICNRPILFRTIAWRMWQAGAQWARQQGGGDADFEIRQDGMPVAATSGPRERSLANAQHYAMMYSADGPVDLVEIVKIAHIDAARAQRAAAQEKPE